MQKLSHAEKAHGLATAHLIIKCKGGAETDLFEQLRSIEGVREIRRIIGEFDIVVKIESDDSESLRRLIKWKVMKNDKIQSVSTLMCMRKSLCTGMAELGTAS